MKHTCDKKLNSREQLGYQIGKNCLY